MRWLDQGQGEAGVKILHIGNIANNAYNNAKFQRRVGIQADVLCYDYSHVMAQPEWEDAEFQEEVDEYYAEWAQVNLKGFRRPDWFRYLDFNQLNANHFNGRKPLFRGQFTLELKWMRYREVVRTAVQFAKWRWAYSRLVHHRHDQLQYDDVASQCVQIRYLAPFLKEYDLVQAYGREFVIFCPSRQNWALKGNDKVIRALTDVVNRQKLDVVLLLCRWGQEVERSQRLIEELGIGRNVVWLPPLNKMRLVEFYNAA